MDELYTVKEVSKILKVNVHKVYELINSGLLPALKVGSIKIRRESLLRFLEENDGNDLTDTSNVVKMKMNNISQ